MLCGFNMKKIYIMLFLSLFLSISTVTTVWASANESDMYSSSIMGKKSTTDILIGVPDDTPFYYLKTPVPVYKITGGNVISATWDSIKYADGYAIFVYKGNSKEYSNIYYVKGKHNTRWRRKFPLGNTYRIQIGAYHDENRGDLQYGEPSPLEDGRIKTAPGKTVISVVSRKKGTYTLNWIHAVGAEAYQIWFSTSNNGKYRLYKTITDTENLTFTKTGLKSDKVYYFKIRAYRKQFDQKNIYGAFSEVAKVRVK